MTKHEAFKLADSFVAQACDKEGGTMGWAAKVTMAQVMQILKQAIEQSEADGPAPSGD